VTPRHVDVVVVARDRLAVGLQRAVHHHAREAEPHGLQADLGRLAVVLVHHDRNFRIALDRGLDQVAKERLAGVLTRPGRRLHDDGAVGLGGGRHDRLDLLEVVDVERRQSVTVLGGVIEQLAHRDEWHGVLRCELSVGGATASRAAGPAGAGGARRT